MRRILLLFLTLPLAAQVTASFSLQPYKAVKASFGSVVATYSADTCNAATGPAVDVDFGRIRQAASTKFAPTAAALVSATISSARNKNVYVKASRFTEIGSGLVTVFQVAKIISLGTTWGTVIASVPSLAHELQGYFDSQGPPPVESFGAAFLPASGKMHLDPGTCTEYLVQGQYVKGLQSFSVEVK